MYDAFTVDGKRYAQAQHVHLVTGNIFRSAMADGLVSRDPTKGRKLPRVEKRPHHIWTSAEARRFIAFTADDELEALWNVLIFTGMRIGEALALRWSHLDFDRRTIRIENTIRLGYDGTFSPGEGAKTRSSNRTVPMAAPTVLALYRHRSRSNCIYPSTLVFPCTTDYARRAFRLLAGQCGVPVINLHGLRHTAATIMLENDVHGIVVQEQLGHGSISITLGTYAHVTDGMRRSAIAAVERAFGIQESDECDGSENLSRQNRVRTDGS